MGWLALVLTLTGCQPAGNGPRGGPGLEPPVLGNPGAGAANDGFGNTGAPPPAQEAPTGPTPPIMGAAGTGGAAGMAAPMPGSTPDPIAGGGAGTSGGTAGDGASSSEPDAGLPSDEDCEAQTLAAPGLGLRFVLGRSIEAQADCEIVLPEDAAAYLPDRVNLRHTRDGESTDVPRVDDAEACDPFEAGFYYDDPHAPTQIHVCPQTCIGFAPDDLVELVYGCPTITR